MVVFATKLTLWFVAIICLGSLILATREPSSLLMSRVGSTGVLRIAYIVEGFSVIVFPLGDGNMGRKGFIF